MTPAHLTMQQAADLVGYCYDAFRKAWPTWARENGFPPPYNLPPPDARRRVQLKWRADAVEAWTRRRVQLGLPSAPPPAVHPANDRAPAIPPGVDSGRLAAERRQMAAILRGA